MGTAVAGHERADRPNLLEVTLVLLICAGLLVGLGVLDDRAQRREAARAAAVLAERGERAAREALTAEGTAPHARTGRAGQEPEPIVIPAGPGWGPATSVVSERAAMRRIDRPRLYAGQRPTGAAAPATASVTGRDDAGTVLLVLMAALGLSMVAGGLRLLTRQPPVGVTR